MSEGTATFTINADPADVRRAFATIVQITRQTNAALVDDSKKSASEMKKSLRELVREHNQMATAIRRIRRNSTNQVVQEEQSQTRIVVNEQRKRLTAAERTQRDHEKLLMRMTQVHARVEQMKTATTLREVYRRVQSEDQAYARQSRRQANGGGRRASGSVSSVTGSISANVGAGVRGFASQFHSERQGARRSHAEAISGLYSLGRQTGATANETRGYSRQFEQAAIEMGVPLDTLVNAAERAQTEFSSLSGRDPRARQANMNQFLANARLARNFSGAGAIGEATRVAGLLSNIGGPQQMQQNTLLSLMRLGELGAVELSSVSREGMTPLMGRIGQAQSQGASVQQQHQMLIQGMAEMEVLRGTEGYRPRMAGNTMFNLATALNSNVVQARMLNNIRHTPGMDQARRTSIENALFEGTGNNRRLRQGLNDPLSFITAAGSAFGNDRTAFSNMFAGSGDRGNAQGLQRNWRTLSGALFTSSNGETGFERVARFQREAQQTPNAQEMARRTELAEADPHTQVVREEETRRNELVNNTGALGRLSDQFERWTANNPLGAMAMNAAGQALGGGIIARLSGFSFGGAGGGAAAGAVPGVAGAGGGAAGLGGLGTAGAIALPIAATLAASTYFANRDQVAATGVNVLDTSRATLAGGAAETAMRDRLTAARQRIALRDANTRRAGGDENADARAGAEFDAAFSPIAIGGGRMQASGGGTPAQVSLSPESMQRFAAALRASPLLVQMDPHDVDHAASGNASANRQGQQ